MRRGAGGRRRDERGALLPMVALLLVVLVPSSALAVDLGMQRVVRRDMQALADVVALDVVRLVDGRTAAQIEAGYNGQPSLDSALADSVARNDDSVLGEAPTVTAKLVHMNRATGVVDTVGGGLAREIAGSEVPNAIEVTAQGAVNFAFVPGRGRAARTAIAVQSPSACFRLGSFAVGVNTDGANVTAMLNAVLPGLLHNTTFSGTLVGYQGLASASLTLLDLVGVSSLGVATPDELLDLDGLTLGQFYTALASALVAQGGHTAEVALLGRLSADANLATTIKVRDLLDIATGDSAALAASFNVLDLVMGAAYAANGEHALGVPGLAVLLPGGLSNLSSSLQVSEAPRLACGPVQHAVAQTGQVDLTFSGDLGDLQTPVSGVTTSLGPLGAAVLGVTSGVLSGSVTSGGHVAAEVHLAQAKGTLTDVVCGDATSTANAEGIDVAVSSSLASSTSLTETVRLTGSLDLTATLPILGSRRIATVSLDLTIHASAPSSAQQPLAGTVSFRHPDDQYGAPKSTGSGYVMGNLSAPTVGSGSTVHVAFEPGYGTSGDVAVSTVPGLSTFLNNVLASRTTSVNSTVVSPLNTVITPQLAKQVGVRVGAADVFALPRPTCSDVKLAG